MLKNTILIICIVLFPVAYGLAIIAEKNLGRINPYSKPLEVVAIIDIIPFVASFVILAIKYPARTELMANWFERNSKILYFIILPALVVFASYLSTWLKN